MYSFENIIFCYFRKMNSEEKLFNWETARKGTFKEFEGLISAEANSDNESMNGHVCSDCDHIGMYIHP